MNWICKLFWHKINEIDICIARIGASKWVDHVKNEREGMQKLIWSLEAKVEQAEKRQHQSDLNYDALEKQLDRTRTDVQNRNKNIKDLTAQLEEAEKKALNWGQMKANESADKIAELQKQNTTLHEDCRSLETELEVEKQRSKVRGDSLLVASKQLENLERMILDLSHPNIKNLLEENAILNKSLDEKDSQNARLKEALQLILVEGDSCVIRHTASDALQKLSNQGDGRGSHV